MLRKLIFEVRRLLREAKHKYKSLDQGRLRDDTQKESTEAGDKLDIQVKEMEEKGLR